jgi:hypothetical protein
MTPFEYVIVLISVILGLGITTILTGFAELIKHTKPVRLYTPYIIWIILIFILHIQDWWLSYKLQSIKVWELHSFLLIIIYPICLYILAHLLFPSSDETKTDSKTFFLERHPRIFIGAIILVLLSVMQNVVISVYGIESQVPQLIVLLTLAGVLITKTKNNLAHFLVAFILLALMVIGFVIDSENLVIK